MIQIFKHTKESIQQAVKRETAYIAERSENFEVIVYDEEYEEQFRDHFLDARANIIEATLAYQKNIPDDDTFFDSTDFTDEDDFTLTLSLPDTIIKQVFKPMTVKMREYLVSYIVYRWLETKIPDMARLYLSRSEEYLSSVKRYCEMRSTPVTRRGMYY